MFALDSDDSAQSELVMGDTVSHIELLGRWRGRGLAVEGTGRQVAPGSG